MNIGFQLQRARKHAGYTQKQLSDKIGVTIKTISLVECDKEMPTKAILKGYEKHTGIPAVTLLFLGMEPKDVKPSKKKAFATIKAATDELINTLFFK